MIFCILFHYILQSASLCIYSIAIHRNVCVGWGWGFQYVNLSSSRLLSRLRSTTTSGPFNCPISLGLIYFSVTILASSFHFPLYPKSSVGPPTSEYCVNFRPKNINFLLRKCQAQGRHYANGGATHVMMSPDTKMSPHAQSQHIFRQCRPHQNQHHQPHQTFSDVFRWQMNMYSSALQRCSTIHSFICPLNTD